MKSTRVVALPYQDAQRIMELLRRYARKHEVAARQYEHDGNPIMADYCRDKMRTLRYYAKLIYHRS